MERRVAAGWPRRPHQGVDPQRGDPDQSLPQHPGLEPSPSLDQERERQDQRSHQEAALFRERRQRGEHQRAGRTPLDVCQDGPQNQRGREQVLEPGAPGEEDLRVAVRDQQGGRGDPRPAPEQELAQPVERPRRAQQARQAEDSRGEDACGAGERHDVEEQLAR